VAYGFWNSGDRAKVSVPFVVVFDVNHDGLAVLVLKTAETAAVHALHVAPYPVLAFHHSASLVPILLF